MTSQNKGHKKTRSVSPLFLGTGSTQYIRHSLNFPIESTTRSNQLLNHAEEKAGQNYISNDPSKQIKTAFLKNKVPGKIYSANQNPFFSNKPEKVNITFTYDSFPSQNKLNNFLQPFPSNRTNRSPDINEAIIEKKNESHSLNTAQKRALNPQMAVAATPYFFNPFLRPYYNLSTEKNKDTQKYNQKNKQLKKGKTSINKNQMIKRQPKGYKDMKNKKKKSSQPKKTERQLQKKNNNITTEQKLEKSQNIKEPLIIPNKDLESLQELQSKKILILQQKLQLLTLKNRRLEQYNIVLKGQLKAYSQAKSKQPSTYSTQNLQQKQIPSQVELETAMSLLYRNLKNKESQFQVQIQKNKQLQAVIATLKESKERYSSEFKKEYMLLVDRLKERESIIQQLQTSNNLLREQYAQLHANIERITNERARQLNQQLEQESFRGEQVASRVHSSSIK